jgi:hypothetical protein
VASAVVQLPPSFDESYHLFIAPSPVGHGEVGTSGGTWVTRCSVTGEAWSGEEERVLLGE